MTAHTALDFWPIALVAGGALVGWGRLSQRVNRVEDDVKDKPSREVVEQGFVHVRGDIARIDEKLDRLLEK